MLDHELRVTLHVGDASNIDSSGAPIGLGVALWRGVIMQAFEDAFSTNKYGTNHYQKDINCRDAHKWLSKPSRDLSMVCNLAMINMESVIRLYHQRLTKETRHDT